MATFPILAVAAAVAAYRAKRHPSGRPTNLVDAGGEKDSIEQAIEMIVQPLDYADEQVNRGQYEFGGQLRDAKTDPV
jgi:hypothetical protein